MSVFSNGGYVPPGMEYEEWVDYLDARYDFEWFQDIEEDLEEDFGPDEEEPEITISDEVLNSIRSTADYVMKDIERSIKNKPMDQKLSYISELQVENQNRLLFEYIKQKGSSEFDFIFKDGQNSFKDTERSALAFTKLNKIFEFDSYNSNDKNLVDALSVYSSILKNDQWAEKHYQEYAGWLNNNSAGNAQSAYAKILNKRFSNLTDSIVQEPAKQKKVDYSVSY